jgi:hypothetical protein
MKPGNILKIAAIAAVAIAGSMAVSPMSASAQSSYYNPDRGGQHGDFRARREYSGKRARNPNRIERRERRRNRAHRRGQRHHFSYKRNHHGKRFSRKQRGYNHFYNGFWYSAPFWTYGYYDRAPAYSYGASDWELHVEWCHNRYRSYNERRDAFKGYDGRWHRCISPYV